MSIGSYTTDSVVDPKGQVYRFQYDGVGRLVTRQHPSGDIVATYQYGWDSEVNRVTNARGQNIDYTYDELHRLTWRGGSGLADAWF